MDFIDRVRELSTKIRQDRQKVRAIETEEATKNAFVMPFILNVLEYNVFDPGEVVPEFTADVGVKKGEKVDYAVLKEGKPIILFECKKVGVELDKEPAEQLRRYFAVLEARFGVVTDGMVYRFYTDLEKPNIMDAKPFLEFNMLDYEESLVDELKKFSKTSFDIDTILDTANELKYTREIKRILGEQWVSPSDEFTRFFAKKVYRGKLTQGVRRQFTQFTVSALHQFVSERISDRLKSALAQEQTVGAPSRTQEASLAPAAIDDVGEDDLTTTEEEFQAFYIVKAILREIVDAKRVAMRDQKSHFSVLLDNNNRKAICRLHFNSARKRLGLFDEQRREEFIQIDDVDDIYKYADRLKATATSYSGETRSNSA